MSLLRRFLLDVEPPVGLELLVGVLLHYSQPVIRQFISPGLVSYRTITKNIVPVNYSPKVIG